MAGLVSLQPSPFCSSTSYRVLTHESFCFSGQSQFLTTPITAKPLSFGNLTLDDPNYEEELTKGGPDSEKRLMEMLAAQAAHTTSAVFEDEDVVAADPKRSEEEKKDVLQRTFIMAASNGNLESVNKILNGKAREYIDVNAPDDEGTPALIYASCFVSAISHALSRKLPMLIVLVVGTRVGGTGVD